MMRRLSIALFGLAAGFVSAARAADQVEILAKGPVHEAYAQPSEREPKPTPVIAKEPPAPVEELPPDQKPEGDNVQWLPGYWAWDDDKSDFLWVSGFWRNAPPGRAWVPGSWRKVEGGHQWTGGFWAAPKEGEKKADVEYLPPPPAPLDTEGPATPAPSENHLYVPGSWVYRDKYVWRPGFWSEHRDGWVYVSDHYRWTPAGYVFVDGYWDYPLETRGVLFAPAYIPPVVYSQPAYVYTPTVVVRESCLFGAFFNRRGYGAYYFGDYFAPNYYNAGFSFWSGNVGIGVGFGNGGWGVSAGWGYGAWQDPLFGYYGVGFRNDPFWGGGGVFGLCVGRYNGTYLRPPTTFIQQNTVINNITNNNIRNNNVNINNVQMLTSLNESGNRNRRLQAVNEIERRQAQQNARETREIGTRRAQSERDLAATPPGKGKGPNAGPRTAKLDLPDRLTAGGPKSIVTPKSGTGRAGSPPKPLTGPGAKLNVPDRVGNVGPKGRDVTPGNTTGPKGRDVTPGVVGPRTGTGKPPVAPKNGVAPKVTPRVDPVTPKNVTPRTLPNPKSGVPSVKPPVRQPQVTPKAVKPPTAVAPPRNATPRVAPPSTPRVAPPPRNVAPPKAAPVRPNVPKSVPKARVPSTSNFRPATPQRVAPVARPSAPPRNVAPAVRSAPKPSVSRPAPRPSAPKAAPSRPSGKRK